MKIGGVEIDWLGHAGFLIKNSKIIYVDPYQISVGLPKADIILITHSHYDHCSIADMEKIVKDGTRIIAPADCPSKFRRFNCAIKLEIIEPLHELDIDDVRILAVPAYNIDKPFHPQNESWVGYVIKTNGVVVYHAGDTDKIPEMQKITGHKQNGNKLIALLPVGGRYTMDVDEALDAAKMLRPDFVAPMHFGSVVGLEEDAKDFVELCKQEGINAEILEKI